MDLSSSFSSLSNYTLYVDIIYGRQFRLYYILVVDSLETVDLQSIV